MKTISLNDRLLAILREAVATQVDNIACEEEAERPVSLESAQRVLAAIDGAVLGMFQIADEDAFALQGLWEVGSEFCHEVGAVEAAETDQEVTVLWDCTDEEWQQISDAIA